MPRTAFLSAAAAAAAVAISSAALAPAVRAEVPAVATDIAPVHGLVARVMDGLGTPELVVRPGATPHGYSLRPSEARALDGADAVFWVGPDLAPWLAGSIDTLAADARVLALIDAPGTRLLEFREGVRFEGHDHGAEGEAHAGHGEDAHDDHAPSDKGHEDHAHDAHGEDHGDGDHAAHDGDHDDRAGGRAGDGDAAHDHDSVDPHAWLDPGNGKAWLDAIAATLSELDPENAGTYAANAAAGRQEIDDAAADVRAALDGAAPPRFVVFHDAYHYFEAAFGLSAAGAISLSDASDPSPARIEEVRTTIAELDVTCVFSEPQFDQGLVDTVLEGTGGSSGVIDPLGAGIETGPGFYPELLRAVGETIAGCGD